MSSNRQPEEDPERLGGIGPLILRAEGCLPLLLTPLGVLAFLIAALLFGFLLDGDSGGDGGGGDAPGSLGGLTTVGGYEIPRDGGAGLGDSGSISGDLTGAGDLSFRVLEVDAAFDPAAAGGSGDANTRIRLAVQAALGSSTLLSSAPFVLLDDTGAEHPVAACPLCPEQMDAALAIGGFPLERSLYFTLPDGRGPAAVIYQQAGGSPVRIEIE